MIISSLDRDLYRAVSDRSARMRALLADPRVEPSARDLGARFLAHWAGVDRGVLTDSDEVRHAYRAQSKALVGIRNALRGTKTAGGTGDAIAWWIDSIVDPGPGPGGATLAWNALTGPSPDVERAVKDCAATWAQLEPQMAANPKLAKDLDDIHKHWVDFYAKWQDGDRDITDVNPIVEEANVARRTAGGFNQSSDPSPIRGVDLGQASPMLSAGTAAEDYCKANPDSALCTVSKPDASWCQRLGVSDTICDKDGLKTWFVWSLGLGGAVLVGGSLYAAYKAAKVAAPVALALGAPELLPAYAAATSGRMHEVPEHLARAQATKPVPDHVERAVTSQVFLSPEAAKYARVRYV